MKRTSVLILVALAVALIFPLSAAPGMAAEQHGTAGQGVAMSWGNNDLGQLGDNSTTTRHAPVQVKGPGGLGNLSGAVALAAGGMHGLAPLSDGTVRAWGYNPDGRLGDDSTTDRHTAVQVKGEGGSGYLTGVVAVSAGGSHSIALKSDGTVWGWGENVAGQLGNDSTIDSHTPVRVKGVGGSGYLTDIVAIAAGGSQFSLALKCDGTVYAWGSNWAGQLGDGTTTPSRAPVQVKGTDGVGYMGDVLSISAGDRHCLALLNDGTVRAWGYNGFGMLGDDSTTWRSVPVRVRDTSGSSYLGGAIAIAGGGSHSMALLRDGTVQAWGYNSDGELGDNTTNESHKPVMVRGPDGVDYLVGAKAISAGGSHSLALLSDGTLRAWGWNRNGQLGDNTTTDEHAPVEVLGPGGSGHLTGVTAVVAGSSYSLAVLNNNSPAAAWGWNSNGQVGDGLTNDKLVPGNVLGSGGSGYLKGTTAVAAGYYHSLTLKSDGTVWAWGADNYGQLGDNTTGESYVPIQVKGLGGADYLTGIKSIAAGYYFSLALTDYGTLFSWGAGGSGQLGDTTSTDRHAPVRVIDPEYPGWFHGVTAIAAGDSHSLALKSNGTVWAWGWNNCGQVGDNTTTNRNYPVQVHGQGDSGFLTGVVAIAAGGLHSLALKSDGTVWAWGYNNDGQLGDGTTEWRHTPVQVHGPGDSGFLTGVTSIAAGYYHSLAVKGDGTAWAWGANNLGQLGNGGWEQCNTTVQVSGLTGVVSAAGGRQHSLALTGDGTAWAWGRNENGQVGNNSIYSIPNAVQVHGPGDSGFLTGVTAIAGGYQHSLAVNAPNPPPAITTISPDHKTAGNAGFTLTVNGVNFTDGSKVLWKGSEKATTFVGPGRLTAPITAGDIAQAGTATVTVVNPEPSEGPSNAVNLKIYPRPAITSLTPASGHTGDVITVKGSNFGGSRGTSYVRFGSVRATSYPSVWNDTTIRVKVPYGIFRTVSVKVHRSGVGDSNTRTFKVTPYLTSVSPTSGKRGSNVTIRGRGFGPKRYSGSYVKFGGKYVSNYYWTDNRIVVLVPAAPYGTCYIKVTTTGGTSNGKVFTVKR